MLEIIMLCGLIYLIGVWLYVMYEIFTDPTKSKGKKIFQLLLCILIPPSFILITQVELIAQYINRKVIEEREIVSSKVANKIKGQNNE